MLRVPLGDAVAVAVARLGGEGEAGGGFGTRTVIAVDDCATIGAEAPLVGSPKSTCTVGCEVLTPRSWSCEPMLPLCGLTPKIRRQRHDVVEAELAAVPESPVSMLVTLTPVTLDEAVVRALSRSDAAGDEHDLGAAHFDRV